MSDVIFSFADYEGWRALGNVCSCDRFWFTAKFSEVRFSPRATMFLIFRSRFWMSLFSFSILVWFDCKFLCDIFVRTEKKSKCCGNFQIFLNFFVFNQSVFASCLPANFTLLERSKKYWIFLKLLFSNLFHFFHPMLIRKVAMMKVVRKIVISRLHY